MGESEERGARKVGDEERGTNIVFTEPCCSFSSHIISGK